MAFLSRIIGNGISPFQAVNINGEYADNLTATGSTQTDALQLNSTYSIVTTAATGTGVRLPAGEPSSEILIKNLGANTLNVYPPVGGNFNGGTTNAAITVAAGAAQWIIGRSALVWITA